METARPADLLTGRWGRRAGGDLLRWALLLAATLWAASPLLTRAVIGGGDAVWYHHQVADAVTQFRAGTFPVLVGQTHYSWNGAVHPIRTAPALQYTAGLIDWLSGRRLEFATLLNLAALLSFLGAATATYAALVWVTPAARWRAAGLTWIYVSAPAVLALPFAQDLYMSTMAVPWVPMVFAAALRTVGGAGRGAPVVLGAGLGALWWAHSPIALWTTLAVAVVAGFAAVGAWRARERRARWLRSGAVAGVALTVFGCYPILSVLLLRAPGERIVPRILERQHLLDEIQGAFPGVVLPLSLDRPLLTFMQPGYAIGLVLLLAVVAAWHSRRNRPWAVGGLLGCAVVYLVLILPIPGITAWLWRHVPEMWASMTNIWPMQRLGVIIAAMAVVALQATLGPGTLWIGRKAALGFGAAVLGWSGLEVQTVRELAGRRTRSEAETAQLNREENVNVSEYCYQQLPQRPSYFIHGVTDPRMEVRLLDPADGSIQQGNKRAVEALAEAPWLPLVPRAAANPAVIDLTPPVTLQPGVRYLMSFEFAQEDLRGVLRFIGDNLQRVYVLPAAGDAKGFGTGPEQEKSLTLWTTQEQPEAVRIEFIPQGDRAAGAASAGEGGRMRVVPIEPRQLPAEVTSLVPLRLTVRTEAPALLETMRVFIPGWTAQVDGEPVRVTRSAEGLVAVPVPAGTSHVEVSYPGPGLLRTAFWLNLTAWVGLPLALLVPPVQRTSNSWGNPCLPVDGTS